jgi:peptide chain release factor 1
LSIGIHPYKHRDIFLEISAITGGDEANIWVQDLVRMYTHYAEQKHFWRAELVSECSNDYYGFHQAILEIKGAFVGCYFPFENGIHQLKRKSFVGLRSPKINTSTARVTVMPIIDLYEIEIDLHNLEIQHFTPYGLRKVGNPNLGIGISLLYKPSGTRVTCAAFDRQRKNQEKAIEIMASKLYDLEIQTQLGEDVRSEVVRTYDYPSNCVTDRRSGKIHALDRIVNGELDALITALAPDRSTHFPL